MAVGPAPVLVFADLRGGNDEGARLDRAGALQQLPMRLARGHGEGGGNGDRIAVAAAQLLEQAGKPDVVTDRQPEPAERSSGIVTTCSPGT